MKTATSFAKCSRGFYFNFGVSTDTAADGLEAVEKASTGVYDLILMDLAMPGMDGYEATRRIRENEEKFELPRAVIIAVSSFGTKDQCLNCGMDDYVLKPATIEQMRTMLDRWLGGVPGIPGQKKTIAK